VKTAVPAELKRAWQTELGGKLSSVVVSAGKLFVAAIDAHTVHALDADTGKPAWSFTAGGRIDSPPTIYRGRVLFGSADGWVYCLRAADGQLAWRFRAAPDDRRLMAYDLKKLPEPTAGKIGFKVRMRSTTDGSLKNGFLVFGNAPEEAGLVKCGLRIAMKKAVIVQGPLEGGKVANQPFGGGQSVVHEIEVTVDAVSGQVTMKAGKATVTAKLDRPATGISFVGVGALNAAVDFSSIEVYVSARSGDLRRAPNLRRASVLLAGQFLEHVDGFLHHALAGAGFGATVKAGPDLVAAQLVGLAVGQIADPVVR
jgi:hypothetical protein